MFRKLISSAVAIAALGLLGFSMIARADDCCDSGRGKKKCEPFTDTKKVKTHCYSDETEKFCLPMCGIRPCRGWWPIINDCNCKDKCCDAKCDECKDEKFKCGCQLCRKVLIVKVKSHDEPVRKCVGKCCDTGCCESGSCGGPALVAPPAPKIEKIPAPMPAEGKGAEEENEASALRIR